jgi:hypothetical protein
MPIYLIHIANTADAKLPPLAEWLESVDAATPEAGLNEVVDDLRSAVVGEPIWVYLADGERTLTEHIPAWGGDE